MVSKGMERVINLLKQFQDATAEPSVKGTRDALNQLAAMGKLPDDVNCIPINVGGVPVEWITTPDVISDHVIL